MRRQHETQHDHHDDEPDRVDRAPDQRPGDLARGHVGHAQRRRQDRLVGLGVLQLEEHVERAVGRARRSWRPSPSAPAPRTPRTVRRRCRPRARPGRSPGPAGRTAARRSPTRSPASAGGRRACCAPRADSRGVATALTRARASAGQATEASCDQPPRRTCSPRGACPPPRTPSSTAMLTSASGRSIVPRAIPRASDHAMPQRRQVRDGLDERRQLGRPGRTCRRTGTAA